MPSARSKTSISTFGQNKSVASVLPKGYFQLLNYYRKQFITLLCMQHDMKLLEQPFERISKGIKTLELRLYDKKRKALKLGDTIRFSRLPDLTKTVTVKITGLLIYHTFAELLQDLPLSYLGYQESERSSVKKRMCNIYSKEEEAKCGVLGIRIELLKCF